MCIYGLRVVFTPVSSMSECDACSCATIIHRICNALFTHNQSKLIMMFSFRSHCSLHLQISIYDVNDRLLKDSDRLCSLKRTLSTTNYIPIYFALLNTVTSFANCSCILPAIECESSSTIIQSSAIEQILSTCTVITQPTSTADILKPLPTVSNIVLDQIMLEYDEICSPLPNLKRCSSIQDYSMDVPLDLSLKSRTIPWIKT